jgi:uncharacterized RDD family membrane protein YckC
MQSSFERRGFADQLSIETPEQVALEFPVAGIGSRFVALLLDHLIQGSALFVLVLVVVGVMAAAGEHAETKLTGKWFIAGVIFVLFLLFWGYYALFEAFWRGQTPGKRVMKLRVIKDTGRQITLFEALARNLIRYVDYLPGLYLAGVVTMLCNRRNKRLGDLAAGTIVVHERADEQPLLWAGAAQRNPGLFAAPSPAVAMNADPWQAPLPPAPMFAQDEVARLTVADLIVIEAFFSRALDLPLETRAAMAYRILGEMAGKMGAANPEGNPERALEAIATQFRGLGRRF